MRVCSVYESVRTLLLRGGTSTEYAHGLARELAEHHQDLLRELTAEGLSPEEAGREADRRLGDPAGLAAVAIERCRTGSFAGRHRVTALVVLPAVCMVLGWVAVLLAAGWAAGMLSPSFRVGSLTPRHRALLDVACRTCSFGVPAVLAAVFYLWARRRCCGTAWAWASCAVLALAGSFFAARVFDRGGGASLILGAVAVPDPTKVALPLGVGWLMGLWERRRANPRGNDPGVAAAA